MIPSPPPLGNKDTKGNKKLRRISEHFDVWWVLRVSNP